MGGDILAGSGAEELDMLAWLTLSVVVILGIGLVSVVREIRLWWRGGP